MRRIDLYLGGEMGLWALHEAPANIVARVITLDEAIFRAARQRGIEATLGDANAVDFPASERALSVHYPRILGAARLERYRKAYNLHPGYLPWGRGFYPVFWALWEGTPAGATLHEMAAEVDRGPIVAQIKVEHHEHDTGGSLLEWVREAERTLFRDYAPRIAAGEPFKARPQSGDGSFHTRREFFELKHAPGWSTMAASDFVRLVRSLTCPEYSGWTVALGGRDFELRLEPRPEHETRDATHVRDLRDLRSA